MFFYPPFLRLQLCHIRLHPSVKMSFSYFFSTQQTFSAYVISVIHIHMHRMLGFSHSHLKKKNPFRFLDNFFYLFPLLFVTNPFVSSFLSLVTCLASFPASPTCSSSEAKMTSKHTHKHAHSHTENKNISRKFALNSNKQLCLCC